MKRRLLALWMVCASTAQTAESLGVCVNSSAYPPFRYDTHDADGAVRKDGFHQALLLRILSVRGWQLEQVVTSQLRCLQELRSGKRVQLFVGGYSDERAQEFYASTLLDAIHFHYFYSKTRFPKGLTISDRNELVAYKVCGIRGHNFSMFGLEPRQIDMGADDFPTVFAKLKRQRCEVFPYNIEVVQGYKLIGQDLLADPDIEHQAMPGLATTGHALFISRAFPQALRIQKAVNEELAILRSNGEYERLARAYGLTPLQP